MAVILHYFQSFLFLPRSQLVCTAGVFRVQAVEFTCGELVEPTCGEPACPELVEGVEPYTKASIGFSRVYQIYYPALFIKHLSNNGGCLHFPLWEVGQTRGVSLTNPSTILTFVLA